MDTPPERQYSIPVEKPVLAPEARVALINRTENWGHIKQRMKAERERKTFAFIVAAIKEEWPESLKHRLALHLKLAKPYSLNLDSSFGDTEDWKNSFKMELLKYFSLPDIEDETNFSHIKELLTEQLSQSETSLFFYCLLKPEMSANQNYIKTIVSSWELLELSNAKKQHVLLIVYGTKEKGFLSFGEKKVENWRKTLLEKLKKQHPCVIVPALQSPSREDVNHWIESDLEDSLEQTKFEKAFAAIKGSRVSHLKLKQIYIEIANS